MDMFSYCFLCKFRFSRVDVDQFMEHCRHHNISFNQEFVYAASCLDREGVERTLKFMISTVCQNQNKPGGQAPALLSSGNGNGTDTNGNESNDDEETVLTIDVDVVNQASVGDRPGAPGKDMRGFPLVAGNQDPLMRKRRGRPRKVPLDDPDYYPGQSLKTGKRLGSSIKKETSYFTHSSKLYTCNLCGDKVRNLLSHNLIYHKGQKPEQFICGVCNIVFSSSERLLSHYVVHSNEEKQFKCKVQDCQFAAKTLGNLRKHEASVHFLLKPIKASASAQVKGISLLHPNISTQADYNLNQSQRSNVGASQSEQGLWKSQDQISIHWSRETPGGDENDKVMEKHRVVKHLEEYEERQEPRVVKINLLGGCSDPTVVGKGLQPGGGKETGSSEEGIQLDVSGLEKPRALEIHGGGSALQLDEDEVLYEEYEVVE